MKSSCKSKTQSTTTDKPHSRPGAAKVSRKGRKMKKKLAQALAEQMKKTRPEIDIQRTTKILVKGMTIKELEKAIGRGIK